MAETAYTNLKQRVLDLTAQADRLRADIAALRGDASYVEFSAKIDRLVKGGYGPNTWIDVNGIAWDGNDARQARASANTHVNSVNATLTSKQGLLNDIERPESGLLAVAQKNLSEYEKNSPTITAQLVGDLQTSARKTLIVIGVIIVVITIATIVIRKYRKNKKTT